MSDEICSCGSRWGRLAHGSLSDAEYTAHLEGQNTWLVIGYQAASAGRDSAVTRSGRESREIARLTALVKRGRQIALRTSRVRSFTDIHLEDVGNYLNDTKEFE